MGHQVGDMLLHAVASRLADCVRESDTVARLGGDEFVIVIADLAAPEDAITVIEKSRQALMVPFYIEDQELALTTSIGVSYYPKDGDDPDSLLRNADIAMYYAKEAGGDAFRIYSPTMNTLARERVEFENSLRKALERQEFVLYYQPVISLDTGKIVCAEVLLRWQNPKLGLVMPQEFIPITEDTGLIGPLGEWLLQEACAQTKQWQLEGFAPIKIAVNLSAKQFNQGDVADMVEKF
ncbi:MAG: diguanylate cyclase [Coxiellaceae bacterium]|nr:MAG: diguanylate cyclase [Coxiellaceae bacterium]